MPVLILAAPMTGRTWLVTELKRRNIDAVDLDAIMAGILRQHGLDTSTLPPLGPPTWYATMFKKALALVPTNAQVYIGGGKAIPFMPPFLCKSPLPTTLFLEIKDLEQAYRRKFLPMLPSELYYIPVVGLKLVLSAIVEDISPFPFYENFVKHYRELGKTCSVHMTADDILMHLEHCFKNSE